MSIKLYEVESPDGSYHEHWLASSPRDAAQRTRASAASEASEVAPYGLCRLRKLNPVPWKRPDRSS